MKEIKSIILYLDSIVAIEHLTDEQAGILIKGVFRYARDGQQLTSSDTALIALFSMLCNQIDRDHKKYEERCERNSANARKRYTNLSQCVQSHLSENPGVKRSVVLSPALQLKVNSLLAAHSDLQSFMRVMNPSLQQYSAEHVERAFFGTAPTLFTLRHAYHDDAATICDRSRPDSHSHIPSWLYSQYTRDQISQKL